MRTSAALALVALLAGCSRVPAPSITSVSPAAVPVDRAARLAIRGEQLEPRVVADLDDPAASKVDEGFEVALRSGDVRVPLRVLRVLPPRLVEVELAALAAAPGGWDLELVDPRGARASLAAALTITPAGCAGLADGSACDDGDACTRRDSCQQGVCSGSDPVVCEVDGPCRLPGSCDPASGACSSPAADDGSACDLDADGCTLDTCEAGACAAGPPRVCNARDACHEAGTCDSASGECSDPALPDGTPCGPGGSCDLTASCLGGTCVPESSPGVLPPLACLRASPAVAVAGATPVTLDASCSTDRLALEGRFRFDARFDRWDTDFAPELAATLVYDAASVFTAAVEVRNRCAVSSAAETRVVVVPGDHLVRVTTAVDEDDPGATTLSPGGAGFSLREAIRHVNREGEAATISFDPEIFTRETVLRQGRGLPSLDVPAAVIAGLSTVTLDFGGAELSGMDSPCVRLGGAGQGAYHLHVTGCAGTGVLVAASGVTVADSVVEGVAGSIGILARAPAVLGPGLDTSGAAVGIALRHEGTGGALRDGRSHGNDVGLEVSNADGVQIVGYIVDGNSGSGILLRATTGAVVLHSTVHGNGGSGVEVDNNTREVRLQNDLFTGNALHGIDVWPQTTFLSFDHLGVHGNGVSPVNRGPVPGEGSVVGEDPLFADPTAGDFRLRPGSPAIDAGTDTGLDRNGALPATFEGAAPDLGARESR